jgi:competence protein ComEC
LEATVRKPLVYYCLGIIIGCFCGFMVLEKYFIGAVLLAASFLICIFLTIDYKKFSVVIFIFTAISFVNYIFYFNALYNMGDVIKMRVREKSEYNNIGEFKGKKLLLKGNLSQLEEGDLVTVQGNFEKSPIYDKGIVGVYNIKTIEKKTIDNVSKMYVFKRGIYKKYEKVLGSSGAGMVLAACFGDTTYIKKEQKEDFNRLGILHVVSVSGLHLAIIYKLLEGLGGLKLSLPLSFIYVVFTGGEAATWRAFIMIIILKLSKKLFKNYDPISALSLSAMLLIFYKPYFITDIGFNLSFLSMLGIFLTYKSIRNRLIFLPQFINDAISLSLSAQFLSAPYIIAMLNNYSLGFLLGNLFLISLFSALVIVGNLSLIFINIPIVFNILSQLLKFILISIEGGSELLLPLTPEVLQLSSIYSVYIIIIYCSYILFKAGKKKYVYMPLILIPLLFFDNYKLIPEIDYVKINYSNCIILKYKAENMLILDKKEKNVGEDKKFLKLNKINKIIILEDQEEHIKLYDYNITIIKNKSKNSIDLILKNRFKGKVLLSQKEEKVNSAYKKYDIINLDFRSSNKKYDIIASIRILFGRYYVGI